MTHDSPTAAPSDSPAAGPWSEELDVEYRQLSVPALLTAAVGLLSLPALLAPSLLFVPLLGLVLALIAWRQAAARPGQLRGLGWAWLGAAIVLFVLGTATARSYTERTWVSGQARLFAEQWLRDIQAGRTACAHELTLPRKRVAVEELLQGILAEDAAQQKKYEEYWQKPPLSNLRQAGAGLTWEFNKTFWGGSNELQTLIGVRFLARTNEAGAAPLRLELVVERRQTPHESEPTWLISTLWLVPESDW